MDSEHEYLQDHLYYRAGELRAHLGRYDMYALALTHVLERQAETRTDDATLSIDSRGANISGLLKNRGVPPDLLQQFDAIDGQLHDVLKNQLIRASRAAVIGTLRHWQPIAAQGGEVRKWFETGKETTYAELLHFIGNMEQDIATVVRLYLQIATLALRVEDALARH